MAAYATPTSSPSEESDLKVGIIEFLATTYCTTAAAVREDLANTCVDDFLDDLDRLGY